MDERERELFRFREFEIDTGGFRVLASGKQIPVERRVYDLVIYLIRHRNRLVTKGELLEKVWQQSFLSDSAIARCVSAARRVFRDPDCIENVYGRGYRWTVPIVVVPQPPEPRVSSPPQGARKGMLGRQGELDLVDSLARRAAGGDGGVCLVSGDAGIGKTRFLRAARDVAVDLGARIAIARCRDMEGAPPYWPWSQIVRALFDSERDLPENLRSILLSEPDADRRSAGPPRKSRILVWEALAESILDRVRGAPTALLFDDLHEADVGSALLFEFVSERAADLPLLIVATYRRLELERDAARSACVQRVVRAASPLIIELGGLGIEDTAAFLRERSGVQPPKTVVEHAHALTAGNPFFLAQVAPLLGADHGEPKLVARRLPSTVRASIQSQIESFSPACRAVLEVASVIGRVIPAKTAASALNWELDDLALCVAEAHAGRLVTPSVGSGESFAFVHDLVREVLYEGLEIEKRGKLHWAVAEALEASESATGVALVEEIAYHFGRAGRAGGTERAIDSALRAAKAATDKFAYEVAREHLTRVVTLMDENGSGDQDQLCSVLVDLGSAELNSGNEDAAWGALDRALQIANQLGRTEQLVRTALALTSSFHFVQVHLDLKRVGLLETLIARMDRGNPGPRTLLLSRLLLAFVWLPDLARRVALAREARELARQSDDPRARASASVAEFFSLGCAAEVRERISVAEDGIGLCRAAGDLQTEQFALVAGIFASLEAGQLDRVREHVRSCREVVHRLRVADITTRCVPLAHAGLLAHIDGRLDDMCEIADEIDRIALPANDAGGLSVSSAQRMLVNYERASVHEAHAVARKWYEMSSGMSLWLGPFMLTLAGTAPDDARARLSKLAEEGFPIVADWQWPYCMAFLALTCSELRDATIAPMLYDKLTPYAERHAPVGAAAFYYGSMHRCLGLLADTMGRFDLADEHLERANVVHAEIGARLMHAHSLCDHALLLERAGDAPRRQKAKELRAQAAELADEMGLTSMQLKLGHQREPADLSDR